MNGTQVYYASVLYYPSDNELWVYDYNCMDRYLIIANDIVTHNSLQNRPDTTLSMMGISADAKAVGDALATKQDKDLVVTITSSTVDGETVFTADKTFAEIVSAIDEGKTIVAYYNYRYFYTLQYQPNSLSLFGTTGEFLSGSIESATFYMTNSGYIGRVDAIAANKADLQSLSTLVGNTSVDSQISNAIANVAQLPAVTEADNGKVLMVVNGKWQLVTLNLSVDENGVMTIK